MGCIKVLDGRLCFIKQWTHEKMYGYEIVKSSRRKTQASNTSDVREYIEALYILDKDKITIRQGDKNRWYIYYANKDKPDAYVVEKGEFTDWLWKKK